MPAKKFTKSDRPTWASLRKQLKGWDTDALLALIKDLHDASAISRDFIQARVGVACGVSEVLETYRERVIEPFYPKRGEAKLRLGEARKAIREYHKATGDEAGTIELLLTYSEAGAEFTNDFGDIDERFYDSLCSAMDDLAARIRKQGAGTWAELSPRLEKLVDSTHGIGWGYHDHLCYTFDELEEEFSSPKRK